VLPPAPPVAISFSPEPRGAVKGAPVFGAAKRTLDSEHGFRHERDETGGPAGTRFLLVSLERSWFGQQGR
jgi:hypothetical protein